MTRIEGHAVDLPIQPIQTLLSALPPDYTALRVWPSHLSVSRLTRMYRSHRPGSLPPHRSPARSRSRRRSSSTPHSTTPSVPRTMADAPLAPARSALLLHPHPQAYSPISPTDTPGPTAGRLLPP